MHAVKRKVVSKTENCHRHVVPNPYADILVIIAKDICLTSEDVVHISYGLMLF